MHLSEKQKEKEMKLGVNFKRGPHKKKWEESLERALGKLGMIEKRLAQGEETEWLVVAEKTQSEREEEEEEKEGRGRWPEKKR